MARPAPFYVKRISLSKSVLTWSVTMVLKDLKTIPAK